MAGRKSLSVAVREAREGFDPKMSQEDLARKANVSVRTVARIENGEPASVGTIFALAIVFPQLKSYLPSAA